MTWFLRSVLAAALVGLLGVATVGADDKAPCPPVVGAEVCPVPTCKVCVPKTEVKKTTKYVYGCKEKDICLPRCGGLFGKPCCADGGCHDAKIRTVRQLVKKPRVEEKCETKCEVEHVAASCPTPCLVAPCAEAPTTHKSFGR